MTGSDLTPAQEIYCVARAEGATVEKASRLAGVTPDTGTRYNRLSAIQARIEELLVPARRGAQWQLSAQAMRAAITVVTLMDEKEACRPGAQVRLRAAMTVLDRVGVGVEQQVTVVAPTLSVEEAYQRIRALAAIAEARKHAPLTALAESGGMDDE